VSFPDAVTTVLTKKYADFSGRARRSEFWFFWIFSILASAVAYFIDLVLGFPAVQAIVFLGLIVPFFAVSARRLHDTNRSGWWYLLWLTFFGGILVIIWWATDSESGTNQYGPSPKGTEGQFNEYGAGNQYGA
jgi:uncharacterized membrane protein YhaH (DUF805 family)